MKHWAIFKKYAKHIWCYKYSVERKTQISHGDYKSTLEGGSFIVNAWIGDVAVITKYQSYKFNLIGEIGVVTFSYHFILEVPYLMYNKSFPILNNVFVQWVK